MLCLPIKPVTVLASKRFDRELLELQKLNAQKRARYSVYKPESEAQQQVNQELIGMSPDKHAESKKSKMSEM